MTTPHLDRGQFLEETFGIQFRDLLLLQELGLLSSTDLAMKIGPAEIESPDIFIYGNTIIVLERPGGHPGFDFPIKGFTKVAEELLTLVSIEPDLRYVQRLGNVLKRQDYVVKYGTIVAREGDLIRYTNLQEIV